MSDRWKSLAFSLGLLMMAGGGPCATLIEGPTLLYANPTMMHGGHTFSYALQGKRYFLWGAGLNKWEDIGDHWWDPNRTYNHRYGSHVFGRLPLNRGQGTAAVGLRETVKDETNGVGIGRPLMLRTPDGYLHMFCACVADAPRDQGYLDGLAAFRYYRSARPEDPTEWVDRTELLPRIPPYNHFHPRFNVAVTRDGQQAVLTSLACSVKEGEQVPFNTPVIYIGTRKGRDFEFAPAVKWHEPVSFFYPMAAALPDGIVLVGQVWDRGDWKASGLLVHLDWQGQRLYECELPHGSFEEAGSQYYAIDMRPVDVSDWSRLLLLHAMAPKSGKPYMMILRYDVVKRRLSVVRELPPGWPVAKFLQVGPRRWALIGNDSMTQLCVWEGDLLGGGELTGGPLPASARAVCGYPDIVYVMVPSPFVGSVQRLGEALVMTCHHDPAFAELPQEAWGPAPLLLWRLRFGRG